VQLRNDADGKLQKVSGRGFILCIDHYVFSLRTSKKFRNDLYENFEKRGVVEKRGDEETKSMPHAPVNKL
jgi:hypothetical protein